MDRQTNRSAALHLAETALLAVLESVNGCNADDDLRRANAAFRLAAVRKELLREEAEEEA